MERLPWPDVKLNFVAQIISVGKREHREANTLVLMIIALVCDLEVVSSGLQVIARKVKVNACTKKVGWEQAHQLGFIVHGRWWQRDSMAGFGHSVPRRIGESESKARPAPLQCSVNVELGRTTILQSDRQTQRIAWRV